MPELPPYINREDNQALVTPAALKGSSLYFFPVRADIPAQQAMVDRFLNRPSGGAVDYRAFFPQVFFMFGYYQRLFSLGYPDAGRGYFSYRESGIWVPTIEVEKRGGLTVGTRLVMYPAYMFVDDSHALISGREVQGWPKEFAQMAVSEDPQQAAYFDIRPKVLKTFSPTTEAKEEKLVSFRQIPDSGASFPAEVFTEVAAAAAGIGYFLSNGGLGLNLPTAQLLLNVASIPIAGMQFGFLKQFRDGINPDRACYQAGLEARLKPTKFRSAGLLKGAYDLSIFRADSHPIVKQFGMDPFDFQGVRGFWTDADVELENAVERWSRT